MCNTTTVWTFKLHSRSLLELMGCLPGPYTSLFYFILVLRRHDSIPRHWTWTPHMRHCRACKQGSNCIICQTDVTQNKKKNKIAF